MAKLIAYYSRAGENYFGGAYRYVAVGNTEKAAKMLAETDMPVAAVGALVGYDSPSKFSVAFKSSMGATPSRYRHLVRGPGFRPNGTAAAERG